VPQSPEVLIKLSAEEQEALQLISTVNREIRPSGQKCLKQVVDEVLRRPRSIPLAPEVNTALVRIQAGKIPVDFVNGVPTFL